MTQRTKTPLWDHQRETLIKFENEAQALVAWEMGTGKTLFGLERDLAIRAADSAHRGTLVVAPLATHAQWVKTIEDETGLSASRINPKDRSSFYNPDTHYHVMHYEALRLMPELALKFQHGIFDECHRIKNRNAQQTKAAKKLKIPYLTDMSGSPVTDRPHDIWSILNHLHPKEYRSFWRFFHTFVDAYRDEAGYWIAKGPNERWMLDGLGLIENFYSRVLSEQCQDLPEVVTSTIGIELHPKQRKAYNEMEEHYLTWIEDEHNNSLPLTAPLKIARLQRLQQLALGVISQSEDGTYKLNAPSTKVDECVRLLQDNDSEPIVFFSQFKGPLRLLAETLDKPRVKIPNVSYVGGMGQQIRDANLKRFIDGDAQAMLMTYGAGAEGLDGLQHVCRTVVFLDKDWSPLKNDQALKRVHRPGQLSPVNAIHLEALDTVDQSRGNKIKLKRKYVMQTLGDEI